MTAPRSAALAVGLLLVGIVVPVPEVEASTGGEPAAAPLPGRELFRFAGNDVYESSGLVDRGDVVYTVNDSGDDAVVYGVDPRTGRTVSRTSYAEDVTDVEALAPGADGTLWAADTGDNRANRDDVALYRLRPDGGAQPAVRYPLTYPDGPRDAETLLVQPGTGRVLVVSKSVFGGTVYAAPARLRADRPNRLREVARVPGLVTDGTFLPDGAHLLLRTYGSVTGYRFPGFTPTGTADLPAQRQGEGLAVGPGGRVLVSSEGVQAAVLQVRLPARVRGTTLSGTAAPSRAAPASSPSPDPQARTPARDSRTPGQWAAVVTAALAVAGLGWLALRGSRLRGPRRR